MATTHKQIVKMSMKREQLEAIEVFFAHQGWTLDILEQEEIALPINGYLNTKLNFKTVHPTSPTPSRESTPASSEGDENFEINKFIELVDIKNLDFEDFVVDDDACAHCFWFPCVATLRPNWLGQGCPAMDGNNIIRKDRYFKYVKGLASKGCFKHPAYLLKKRDALDGVDGAKGKYVWAGNKYVREIIPHCVVQLVRELYPNPAGRSYDGEAPLFKIQEKDKEGAANGKAEGAASNKSEGVPVEKKKVGGTVG